MTTCHDLCIYGKDGNCGVDWESMPMASPYFQVMIERICDRNKEEARESNERVDAWYRKEYGDFDGEEVLLQDLS